jgi:hypothetical protein
MFARIESIFGKLMVLGPALYFAYLRMKRKIAAGETTNGENDLSKIINDFKK